MPWSSSIIVNGSWELWHPCVQHLHRPPFGRVEARARRERFGAEVSATGHLGAGRSEAMLQILTGRGASPADAMTYAALIDRHIFGSALQHVEERGMERRYGVTDSGQVANAITAVRDLATASGDYPTLSTWMADPHVATPTEQFDLSLGFLLDGIAAQLRQRERI